MRRLVFAAAFTLAFASVGYSQEGSYSTTIYGGMLSVTVGDLYKVRSLAVHGGRVPNTIQQRPTREVLEEGYRLTAAALVALISKGDPDWGAVTYA